MFDARPDWHAVDLAALPAPIILDISPFQESITDLKNYALSLLEADGNSYALKHLSSSSYGFISTILSTGTLGDRVSALTLVVQESPVHTTKFFEILCGLAKKRGRSQAMVALEAIKDLLGAGAVLPGDRRLFHFDHQPGLLGVLQRDKITCWKQGSSLPRGITKKHMILWAYEDWLKNAYFNVLKVLEVWCNDEVEFARSRAVTYVYELLREKPEQESNLLRLLVNKLGDPDRKIASRTSYLILQLQIIHPLMKSVIIRAIENEVLLRSGQNLYAKYHAINTLNQTILSVKEEDVTRKLLDIYFDLFLALLGTTSEAIVRPQADQQAFKKRSGRVKAGVLKGTAKDVGQSASVITEKLISAILTGVNRALPYAKSDDMTYAFLNISPIVLYTDKLTCRFQTHMDSLFAITHSSNFNTSIQALMLIQQLTASKNIAVDRFYRTLYESLLDPRLASSSKHAMFLNLLFKALRSDLNVKRVKAFVKRLVQVITFHQPPFICGALYLLKELEATFPGLRSLLENAEEYDDGSENFFDVPDGIAVFSPQTQSLRDDLDLKHRDVDFGAKKANTYDARKRDPEHSNADKSCLWELVCSIP
jgi:ribosome biogenesis protein MAK21